MSEVCEKDSVGALLGRFRALERAQSGVNGADVHSRLRRTQGLGLVRVLMIVLTASVRLIRGVWGIRMSAGS